MYFLKNRNFERKSGFRGPGNVMDIITSLSDCFGCINTLWESLIRTLIVLRESGLGSPRVYDELRKMMENHRFGAKPDPGQKFVNAVCWGLNEQFE